MWYEPRQLDQRWLLYPEPGAPESHTVIYTSHDSEGIEAPAQRAGCLVSATQWRRRPLAIAGANQDARPTAGAA